MVKLLLSAKQFQWSCLLYVHPCSKKSLSNQIAQPCHYNPCTCSIYRHLRPSPENSKKNKTKQGRPTILSIHNPLAYRPIQGTAEIFSFIGLTDHVSFVHSLAHLKQFSIHGWPSSLGPASETTSLSDAQSWCFYPELCTLSPASLPTLLSELSWKFSQLPVRPHSPQEARAEQSEQLLWTPDRPQVHSSELSKYK